MSVSDCSAEPARDLRSESLASVSEDSLSLDAVLLPVLDDVDLSLLLLLDIYKSPLSLSLYIYIYVLIYGLYLKQIYIFIIFEFEIVKKIE